MINFECQNNWSQNNTIFEIGKDGKPLEKPKGNLNWGLKLYVHSFWDMVLRPKANYKKILGSKAHKAIHEIFNLRIFPYQLYKYYLCSSLSLSPYHLITLGYAPPPPPPRKLKHLIDTIMDTLINFDYSRKSDEFSDPRDQCGNPYAK